MTIAFITHPDCQLHETASYHPDAASRLAAIQDRILACGLEMILQQHDAPLVTIEQLERVHHADYVADMCNKLETQGNVWLDDDTQMDAESLQAAKRAAGAVVKAVDLVMTKQSLVAFCCVRPPGHHAEPDKAMGFCLFNNVAVGAAHAMSEYGLSRVAIIDFDAHFGNGTEAIFRDEQRVQICSIFQHPFFPHSGEPSYDGHIINIPLAAGTEGDVLRDTIRQHWLPALEAFEPQLILISAGFDGHREDDMSDLMFVEDDYVWITRELKLLADKYAQGRIVSTLEGGYELSSLGRSVSAHINAMF